MKRKKTEESTDPTKFWPIPGVDGEPYAPRVQEALDLVAKETLRRKRAECTHTDRMWITGGREHRYENLQYRRACRDCHLVVTCEHPENGRRAKYARGDMVFSECRCGKLIASRPEVKPRMQTPVYGFEYERKTGTAWLKTEDEERREARTDRMMSRQINRASTRLPIMVSLPRDPGTKPGALERAMRESARREPGAMRRSVKPTTEELDRERVRQRNLARQALQAKLPQVITDPDRAPDLTWVRTMSGKQILR